MSITLKPHGIFYHILHTYAYSTFPNHWHAKPSFLIDMGLLSKCPAYCGQLVKILTTLEPYGIFGSNFAYLFILIFSSHPDMLNGGDGLPSIILTGQGLIVKMLITLEPHGIFVPRLFDEAFSKKSEET